MEGRHNAHAHWPFRIMDKQLLYAHTDGDKDATLHQYTEAVSSSAEVYAKGHRLHIVFLKHRSMLQKAVIIPLQICTRVSRLKAGKDQPQTPLGV